MRRGVCTLNASVTRKSNIRVTFLAYRDWALKAIEKLSKSCAIEVLDIIKTEEEYKTKVISYPDGYVDCIVLLGWSWLIKDDTLLRFLCVGMHPSDLPKFRGGSPIQHQIIAGLDRTKISLMNISLDGIDVGDIWLKEDWDLSGSTMNAILSDLSSSSFRLLKNFFENYKNLRPEKQDLSRGTYFKRRKPENSKFTWEQFSEMKLKDIYNLIRALEDPYPNIYVEDKEGNKLAFKEVAYIPKEI